MLELDKKNKADISNKEEKIAELEEENKHHVSIKETSDVIEQLNEQIAEYSTSSDKLKKLNTFLIKVSSKIQTCQKEHEFFEDNHVCPTCTQDLSEDFRLDKIASGKNKLDEMTLGYNDLLAAIGEEEKRFTNGTNYLLKSPLATILFPKQTLLSIRFASLSLVWRRRSKT